MVAIFISTILMISIR